MEHNPLERNAVTKAAEEAANDTLESARRENVSAHNGENDGFADTVLDFPTISVTDENLYQVPAQTNTIEVTPITGNKPYVPDVVSPAKTVSAIETDPTVLNGLLKNSPLEQAELTEPAPDTDAWTRPAPQRESKPTTSWFKKLLGGK